MTNKQALTTITTTVISLGMMGAAQAGTIIVPDSATANVGLLDPITQIFDQSGLSVGYTEGDDFDAYLAGSPTHTSALGTDVRFNDVVVGSMTFDFGEVATVESLGLWNFSSALSFSVVDFSLEASLTSDFSSSTNLGSFTATVPSGNPSSAEVFAFAPTNAQFIRLNVLSNNGAPFSAIGEVIFEESQVTETIPEPSLLLGLLAMSGVGLLGKKGQKQEK